MTTPTEVTTTEAAHLVGLSRKTILAWTWKGLLAPSRAGGRGYGDENRYLTSQVLAVDQKMAARRKR